ncbi:DUF4190 domain-containing protein [Streptomyces sp. NRRL S-87]|uniref:DUF4190 domain-containing protein n=1 Tax=Streptomyces sp. NRRL S-87 TaxID=1463920 RepID=UPI00190155ED|nr:DUF4190 domain-containing protein [Streptomyces sp. NRRL S-87]
MTEPEPDQGQAGPAPRVARRDPWAPPEDAAARAVVPQDAPAEAERPSLEKAGRGTPAGPVPAAPVADGRAGFAAPGAGTAYAAPHPAAVPGGPAYGAPAYGAPGPGADPAGGPAYGYPGQPDHLGRPAYPEHPGRSGYPGQPAYAEYPGQPGYAAYPGYPGYAGHHGHHGYPGGWGRPEPRNGFGIAALALGILSVVAFCSSIFAVLIGVVAVVFGVLGRGRAKRGEAVNPGQALAGIILGSVGIVLGAVVFVVIIAGAVFGGSSHGDDGYFEHEEVPPAYETGLVVEAPQDLPARV